MVWILLGAIFAIDVVVQVTAVLQSGRSGLGGSRSLLGMWDLAKAIAVGTALIHTSGRTLWRPIGTLGVLFLVVGIEDQIAVHAQLGGMIADLFRFEDWIPDIGSYGATNLGEFLAMAMFAFLAFLLIWAGQKSPSQILRRARVILTLLLVAMFFFAGVVDLITAANRGSIAVLIEELGERAVLSLSVVYAVSLAWTYPDGG